ncbi:hypothetical protein NP233_g12529 [Leucocoprinus birnbaumii]|uniref:Uncharacterized protein n=1 Tax=Leucocoprinus birnbaumii TaxID=56174 RepID=A0AAD5VGU1_9AGAR|nr:hypothetical protein NP233_g12529 [Leucocoprinus birnbaumii]
MHRKRNVGVESASASRVSRAIPLGKWFGSALFSTVDTSRAQAQCPKRHIRAFTKEEEAVDNGKASSTTFMRLSIQDTTIRREIAPLDEVLGTRQHSNHIDRIDQAFNNGSIGGERRGGNPNNHRGVPLHERLLEQKGTIEVGAILCWSTLEPSHQFTALLGTRHPRRRSSAKKFIKLIEPSSILTPGTSSQLLGVSSIFWLSTRPKRRGPYLTSASTRSDPPVSSVSRTPVLWLSVSRPRQRLGSLRLKSRYRASRQRIDDDDQGPAQCR